LSSKQYFNANNHVRDASRSDHAKLDRETKPREDATGSPSGRPPKSSVRAIPIAPPVNAPEPALFWVPSGFWQPGSKTFNPMVVKIKTDVFIICKVMAFGLVGRSVLAQCSAAI
jgi:hypothetical protein